MRIRSLLACAALLAASAVLSPAAAAGCSKGAPARVGAGSGTDVGLDDPRCEFTLKCPASHNGKCTVVMEATMTGNGVVSAFVRGAGADGDCIFANECAATATGKIAPGSKTLVRCGPGSRIAATSLWMECSARIS